MSQTQTLPRPARAVAWSNNAIIGWMRQRIAAAGGDPQAIPDEPIRFLRIDEVERRTSVKKSTIYRWVADGTFPKGVPLGVAAQQRDAA